MKNVVDMHAKKSNRDEAIAWMARLDSDKGLTDAEDAALREWLQGSMANRKAMHELAGMWDKANVLTELAVPLSASSQAASVGSTRRGPAFGWSGIAATVIVAIGAAALFWQQDNPVTDLNGLYTTAVGEQLSQQLPDGSVLLLNTNSDVRIDYSTDFRDVHLVEGEAHFTVAKNDEQPFRVFAGSGRVAAIGTAFSVHRKDDAIDVTVTEGRVAIASVNSENDSGDGDPSVLLELGSLKAGQVATLVSSSDEGIDSVDSIVNLQDLRLQDLSRRMSWTEGSLVFSGEPLRDVVEEIARYTTVSITFADKEIGDIPVGGLYPVSETDYFFKTLESTFGLSVTYQSPTHVIVSAANQ